MLKNSWCHPTVDTVSSSSPLNVTKHGMCLPTSSLRAKPIIISDHKSTSFSYSKQEEQVQIKHKISYSKNFTISTVLEYTLIIQSNAKQTNWNNKSTRAGASKPMTHLTISKHAAVVASHAIFYHWQTSYFKEILLSYQSCEVSICTTIPTKKKNNYYRNHNMNKISQTSLPG